MTPQIEALKLALEALEGADWYINQLEMIVYSVDDDGTHENRLKVQQALNKIKEALAQPEKHQDWCASLTQMLMSMPPKPAPCNCKPPQRKPLPPQSPCEMTQAEGKMFKLGWLECEAAHGIKEKNT